MSSEINGHDETIIAEDPLRILTGGYDLLPHTPDASPMCTWPLDTEAGCVKLHAVMQGGGITLWDVIGVNPITITVDHLAAHYGEFESESRPGEMVKGPIISLLGPMGTWHTNSEWVWLSIIQLIQLIGPPPWLPPVILRAERMTTRKRNVRMALTFIGRHVLADPPG